MEDKKIPVLSFYTGGGFLDMGFEMSGFSIIWSNEFDSSFALLHAAGMTSWRKAQGNGIKAEIFNTKSLDEISNSEIIKEAFPDGKPEVFGIIGGPPCQDFSLNGRNEGFEGQRGKQTTLFFKKIAELQPTFFVMENVPGLIMGQSNREYLGKLLNNLEKQFHIEYKLLNALDFGVPQFRERIFFIGINKACCNNKIINVDFLTKWFPWPENSEYNNAFKKFVWPSSVKFGKRLSKPNRIPIELCVESCLVPHRHMNKIPNANEYFKLHASEKKLVKIEEGETNRPSFKRLHRFKFSPTACYGNNEVHLHPYKNRRLSVREALRIQGVPDEYVLPAEFPLTKKFKMIGNGVPVPLAKMVASCLTSFLKKYIIM